MSIDIQNGTRSPDAVEQARESFLLELTDGQGVDLDRASVNDKYLALARAVRRHMTGAWLETQRRHRESGAKTVVYLSLEYLLGRQLGNALLTTDLEHTFREALSGLGVDLDELIAAEVEPGLGNGGLGRLAACFIDSLATLGTASIGYGIRYEFGIFRQTFVDGRQVEQPDSWLDLGSPWEFPHPDQAVTVGFGGHVQDVTGEDGTPRRRWVPGSQVLGLPYNYMVPGYRNETVNTLRLWSARATKAFDLQIFNYGDYAAAVRENTYAENISKVLYPEDSTPQGKELRLQQQYFFVACSLRNFIDSLPEGTDLHDLPRLATFQLNDTHPVIAIPELMRILVDEQGWDWDDAWDVTRRCFAYTCHTLLPEALEVWPVTLLASLLPRHLEIIYRINDAFLAEVRAAHPEDELRARRMSIIQEHPERAVRMAFLATVGSFKVNGVAALHSQLLRDKVLNDFSALMPEKFENVTNGVTPRRFIRLANPDLSALISEAIGKDWVSDLSQLSRLEPLADDPEFRARFAAIKRSNKDRLVQVLAERDGIHISPDTMLDVMVKRLHEYKRQTLKLLHIVALYDQVTSGERPVADLTPRTFVFGAKAAPGYRMAKDIIHLINSVGAVVNSDPLLEGRLAVAFPANYNVTLAQTLIPAADLSEQISLAGKEASGTGNMKFALNGALTVGTLDGANVEIREFVGDDNFFLFGLTEPEVEDVIAQGYRPSAFYESNRTLRRSLDLIASGAFSGGDRGVFEPIVSNLLNQDRFLVLADFQAYLDVQHRIDEAYLDQDAWTRKTILNVARSGFFSSDRSIRDYLDRIWHA